jgi:predicted ATPase
MRIAISGTQCLGKTTLINDIIEKYPQFSTTSSTYRDQIKNYKLKCNKQADVQGQTIIMNKVVDELMLNHENTDIIFDRCVFDALIYTTWAGLNSDESDIDETVVKLQFDLARFYAHYYDKIIFIPMLGDGTDPVMEEDNLRETDEGYRIEVNELFESLYAHLGEAPEFDKKIAYINGTREERLEKFAEFVME